MLKRLDTIVRTMSKDKAILRTAMSYHDGQVNCRLVYNSRDNRRYFMQGQLVRDCYTGRFVSLSAVLKG